MKVKTLILSMILAFMVVGAGYAQVVINAMVADSASMRPLSDVNVRLKKGFRGTTTSAQGYFFITALETDTLIFTRIGYITAEYPVIKLKETLIVYLTEESILLQPVTITGNMIIPGLPQIAKSRTWENNTGPPRNARAPIVTGFQGFETFGPGYVARGVLSKYSKEAQEKKKLKVVQEENRKAKSYIDVINDPEVKDRFMRDLEITEQKFFEILALFNEKNKDIIYEMEAQDLVTFLELFFKEQLKK